MIFNGNADDNISSQTALNLIESSLIYGQYGSQQKTGIHCLLEW